MIEIKSTDGIIVRQMAGATALGDVFGDLEVSVSEMHSVAISDHQGNPNLSSVFEVCPLRLANGKLRPNTDPEPKFHPDAHYLVRIVSPSMTNDRYHQFDKDGKYLG